MRPLLTSIEAIAVFGVAKGGNHVGGKVYCYALHVALEVKASERHLSVELIAGIETSPDNRVVVHHDATNIHFCLVIEIIVTVIGVPTDKSEIAT